MALQQGQYHPRMARNGHCGDVSQFAKEQAASRVQLKLLIEALNEVFATVEPCPENFGAFGHKIRNLLMVACTEFEAQCVGVLKANDDLKHGSYTTKHGSYTTNDYVKLLEPMKLKNYETSMSHFPSCGSSRPFDAWDDKCPTKSLMWYDAYNKTKHDREANFSKATLKSCIMAISACACIHNAQFSASERLIVGSGFGDFRFLCVPDFDEDYSCPLAGGAWTPVFYRF